MWGLVVAGLIENATYASAGYWKARNGKKASFEWKRWLRTVITGAVPPVALLVLGYFGVELPAGWDVVAFVGPALDQVLRKFL